MRTFARFAGRIATTWAWAFADTGSVADARPGARGSYRARWLSGGGRANRGRDHDAGQGMSQRELPSGASVA
jgi:hypothetical protein